MSFETHIHLVFPELFLFFAFSGLLFFGVFFTTSFNYHLPLLNRPFTWLTLLTLFICSLLCLWIPEKEMIFLNGFLSHSYFTQCLHLFLFVSALICLSVFLPFFQQTKINHFEYLLLFFMALLGMSLLISSNDLISMYLAIEMQSLSFYLLATLKKNSAFSTEAGLKYFILGALSSGFLLFGMSLIYGVTGTTSFEEMSLLLFTNGSFFFYGLIVGLLFLSSGLFFKLAAAPFHMWSPDVYEGAPTPITSFFAIFPKIALMGLILQFYYSSLFHLVYFWEIFFIFSSFSSMVVGTFGALQQKKIKRLLAYSSIGHVGFLFLGMGSSSLEGNQAVILYLLIYIVMSLNIWTIVLSLSFYKDQVHYLTDLSGLSKSHFLLAITLSFVLFSMAGVPPLAGFCAKLYILIAAMDNSLYVLAFVGVLLSCMSTFYYIRLCKVVFFEKTASWKLFAPIDREKSIVLGTSTFFLLFFFLYPNPFLLFTYKMALFISL